MIKDQSARCARIMIWLIVTAIAMAAIGIGYTRFGGPLHRQNLLQDELLADILPPPAFVVEPYLHATWVIADPAHAQDALAELTEEEARFRQRKAYWASAPVPDELREEVTATIGTADAFWTALDKRFIPAMKAGDLDTMRRVHALELAPAYRKQHDAVAHLVEESGAYRAELMSHAYSIVAVMLAIFALVACAIVAVVILTARRMRDRVIAPLVGKVETLQQLADGDYSGADEDVDRHDEIGMMARAIAVFRRVGLAKAQAEVDQHAVVAALSGGLDAMARQDLEYRIARPFPEEYEELRTNYNTAIDALAMAMRTVRVGASSVLSSISEIRDASDDIALRNEQQAASLAQTAGAMNSVTGSVRETAMGAQSVQRVITSAHAQASEGGEVVKQAVAAMAQIEVSAQQISQIISVIDGIAFQTNLLALNAGVEAARAGESGKGFAVVATEVRALAQRSAEAAQHIKELIETSTAQVTEGVRLVDATGEHLTGIVDQIASAEDLVSGIADVAVRQAESLEQVNAAVASMDRMTQANAAMVEQSSAATRSLSSEAKALAKLVSSFRTREVASRPVLIGNPDGLRRKSALGATPAMPVEIVRYGT